MSYSWVTPQQDLQITTICHMMQMAAGTGQHDTVDYLIHATFYYYILGKSSISCTRKHFFKIIHLFIKMCRKLCQLIWGIWQFHRSKDFEAMKAGKLGVPHSLSCWYTKNKLMDKPWIHIRSASHWFCLELQLCVRHPTENITLAQTNSTLFNFLYQIFKKLKNPDI